MARKPKDLRKPAPTNSMRLLEAGSAAYIVYTPEGGGTFTGTVDEVNALLTAMGYHEIAVRRQLMSGVLYIEAKLTPLFLSPASETYWSM